MTENEAVFEFSVDNNVTDERYALAIERVEEISFEHLNSKEFDDYFHTVRDFIAMIDETYKWAENGGKDKDSLEDLKARNERLYSDIIPENYGVSYGNPTYACNKLGNDFGKLLSALYFELRSMIPYAFELQKYEIVIRTELFLEVYGVFVQASSEGKLPEYESIRQIMYWFYSDYAEEEKMLRFAQIVNPEKDYFRDIIMNSDLSDIRYLYKFGEYITDNEIKTAKHLMEMSEEEIDKIADTFTEGYRIGFAATGKDIGIKSTASVIYILGFERIIKKAVLNLEKIGLKSGIFRSVMSGFFMGGSARRNACHGAIPNKQFDYDHKDDDGLFLDAALVNRRLEAVRAAGEKYKKEAKLYGGPAVLEGFGAVPFSPEQTKEAVHLSAEQSKLLSDYKIHASLIQNEYIIGKERSFTIISFPVPDIGEQYEAIFDETVKINTLDYNLYQNIQKKIIDALDEAKYVTVKGMGNNRTDITVMLHEIKDKDKETNFENCVADVNIPVGEVFTSPVLAGTSGILHVTGVYLKGLYFKDLEIKFKDGCIENYNCSNFIFENDNKNYIKENIMYNHDTLPIGEFAIGTNTTAYMFARKFGIADKLDILIAEKTGPHFAVGDTCYSYEEDNDTYNFDGKRHIAKENEISAKRKTDPDKAYFSCHTDITIPYDELGEIKAVREDGTGVTIIKDGRFVLPGTEELNKPLDE